MALPPNIVRLAIAATILSILYFVVLRGASPAATKHVKPKLSFTEKGSKLIVMGRMSDEDTSWVKRELPGWQSTIYTVDTTAAGTKPVPANKGREAMSYLTYIIEHYDALPETMVFLHSHRSAWHTDIDGNDVVQLLKSLQIDYVQREGYANLRCQWNPGCPAESWGLALSGDKAKSPDEHKEGNADAATVLVRDWTELFGDEEPMPSVVAGTCCSQFVVSKENVARRTRKDYVRLRYWLLSAEVSDDVKADIFEHLWQVIFGWNPITCPKAKDCYCNLYGKCNKGLF